MPFSHQFLEDRDPTIKTRLKENPEHQEAILAWIVAGCLLWQKHGLCPPAEVIEATGEYRKDSQPLTGFLEDCCVIEADAESRFQALWDAYQEWGGSTALLNRQGFINAMTKKFRKGTRGRNVIYEGVALRETRTYDGSKERETRLSEGSTEKDQGNWTMGIPPVGESVREM